jgi:hypothetical protein
MPSLEGIYALCQGVGEDLEKGPVDTLQDVRVATVLLLALGSIERRVGEFQFPAATQERVMDDLAEARSALAQAEVLLHTSAVVDRRADLLEARRQILNVLSVLLGTVGPE